LPKWLTQSVPFDKVVGGCQSTLGVAISFGAME